MEYNKDKNPFSAIDYSTKVLFYESEIPEHINADEYLCVNVTNDQLKQAIVERYRIKKFPALMIYTKITEDISSHEISKLEGMKAELIREVFQKLISENKIVLIMKGTVRNPYCKFSKEVVHILSNYVDLDCVIYYDILMNDDFRSEIKKINQWPTFPQLFINGEFIGGSDIIRSLHESGELKQLLEK